MRRAELVVCMDNIVNKFKILIRTPEGEILFQKSVRKWKVDVTVDFKKKKKCFQVVDYTVLLTGRIKLWIFPKTIKYLGFKCG